MKKELQYLGDGYKYSHKDLYGKGIKNVFTNMVARDLRYMDTYDGKIVAFGVNVVVHELDKIWKEFKNTEFNVDLYNDIVKGDKLITADDWLELQKLDNLPILIKGVRDGSVVDLQTPLLHIEVTNPDFFWLGQYLETFISQMYWPLVTAATKSREIKHILDKYGELTSEDDYHAWRAHDFGARGHQGTEGSALVGLGHLLYCDGSDNILAYRAMREHYFAIFSETEHIPPIVNASEHSVMCSRGEANEKQLFSNLLDEYNDILLSLVIDGYDQDNFIYNIVPEFKDKIKGRGAPLVLRPDSGDMIETLLKYSKSLADTFGYKVNDLGYKVINNVSLIWGDGCTAENIEEALKVLSDNGFALDNYLFGVGSYYYISSTRDTLSMAVKATAILLDDGTLVNTKKIVKSDPTKASLDGLVAVDAYNNSIKVDSYEEFKKLDKRAVYFDGFAMPFDCEWTTVRIRSQRGY